jgi:hypothetical protein
VASVVTMSIAKAGPYFSWRKRTLHQQGGEGVQFLGALVSVISDRHQSRKITNNEDTSPSSLTGREGSDYLSMSAAYQTSCMDIDEPDSLW